MVSHIDTKLCFLIGFNFHLSFHPSLINRICYGYVGSCWVFGAVAAIEGLIKIKTGNLVSLSEQQIIDCISTSDACNGGWMDMFLNLLRKIMASPQTKTILTVQKKELAVVLSHTLL